MKKFILQNWLKNKNYSYESMWIFNTDCVCNPYLNTIQLPILPVLVSLHMTNGINPLI